MLRRADRPARGDRGDLETGHRADLIGQLAFLEARHRAHARVEDRIRHAKDTGLGRFPSREFAINQEFLRFLKQVAKTYPRRQLHIVCDNYGSHKHPKVNAWLAKNPRITLHFTPTSGSWLNLVEVFFGILTRQAIRRGTFASVRHRRPQEPRFSQQDRHLRPLTRRSPSHYQRIQV